MLKRDGREVIYLHVLSHALAVNCLSLVQRTRFRGLGLVISKQRVEADTILTRGHEILIVKSFIIPFSFANYLLEGCYSCMHSPLGQDESLMLWGAARAVSFQATPVTNQPFRPAENYWVPHPPRALRDTLQISRSEFNVLFAVYDHFVLFPVISSKQMPRRRREVDGDTREMESFPQPSEATHVSVNTVTSARDL